MWLMAQIDGSSNTCLRPVRSIFGSLNIRHFQESTCASSKLIAYGDIVSFDTVVSTHKRIVVAPSSQGAAGTVLENGGASLLGVALGASTSDGSTTGLGESTSVGPNATRTIPVAVADGFTEYAINVSSVGGQPLAPCSSMIGNTYAVIRVAAFQRGPNAGHSAWFLDSTNSTAADLSFVVTDVAPDQVGTSGGQVYGKFLSTMVSRAVRLGGPFT
jgi:hypothetical protein